MRLMIDNEDGSGYVDYTAAVTAAGPLTILRESGRWTTCSAVLDVAAAGLPMPVTRAAVLVQTDAGTQLFSGSITGTPIVSTAIEVTDGEVAAVHILATETAFASEALPAAVLQPASSQGHPVTFEENALHLREAREAVLPMLATDVILSGEMGAGTYVTELFQGDGTTVSFPLTAAPFRVRQGSTLLQDSFDEGQFAAQRWQFIDAGQHIGLGGGGLEVTGGNGLDGQTVMQAVAPIELGGTLLAELASVALQPGSDGVVLGMYSNAVGMGTCMAGFRVKGTAGAQTIVPLINGAETGTPYTFAAGHLYTLRLRLHCPELQRVLATYQAVVDGTLQSFGGGLVEGPLQMVLEIRDEGLASSTAGTVLYSGALASSPARVLFAPVNSTSLMLQAGGCTVKGGGSAWVVSTLADGTVVQRREAAPEQGGDFAIHGNTLHYFPGRAPAAGELVSITYRRGQRSVAHVQDAAALLAAQTTGPGGALPWSGSVTTGPVSSRAGVSAPTGSAGTLAHAPRSAADCAAAAQALLAFANAASTGRAGTCTLQWNAAELDSAGITAQSIPQVGDRMLVPVTPGSPALQLPVTRVTLSDEHAVPELLQCKIDFEQRHANGLSFQVSRTLHTDVAQPVPVTGGNALPGLPGLQVLNAATSSTGSSTGAALQVDAGTAPPNGGGFEVRRRDGGFGGTVAAGSVDADLVLRTPVRGFSIPRLSFAERFYVRMFDGNSPANYSAVSALIVTHLPTS